MGVGFQAAETTMERLEEIHEELIGV